MGYPWNEEPGFFYLKSSMRAARALARLRQDQLASRAGLQRQEIIALEDTSKRLFSFPVMEKARAALQKEGVHFMPDTAEHGPAVAIKVAEFFSGQMLALCGARALAGLSQDDLAIYSGISRHMIARIDDGRLSVPVIALATVRAALAEVGVTFLPETEKLSPPIALTRKPSLEPRV
jgi:DNA-binding XRE family transcriptional regulator